MMTPSAINSELPALVIVGKAAPELVITHVGGGGYIVSSAAAFIANLPRDEFVARHWDGYASIYAAIHITEARSNEQNPRRILVGELYPDGKLWVTDNTYQWLFLRFLTRNLAACEQGEGCAICRWCKGQEELAAG